jgi:CTP synthase
VITKERRGSYLGRTVPGSIHIDQRNQGCDPRRQRDVDIALIEIGGTVGDIESLPFLEAIRQFRQMSGATTRFTCT